ncbi:MAG: zf-HC2 domain-containing protein [Clostridium sp.]|nr:zf-HC2 domain-containing protein [Clostridium sp.]
MNKEIDCNIIGDLLPSYLSNITSFNTNKIIEEHINRCSKCEKKLAYMKRDISLNTIKESIDHLKINYFKKIHKKFFYILLISILIMIISFIVSVFLLEKNTDEAIFTFLIFIFVIVRLFVKLILPILGLAIGIVLFKRFKNIWIKCISMGISCISVYYLIQYIIFILNNG